MLPHCLLAQTCRSALNPLGLAEERLQFIRMLQEFSLTKGLRVSILSGGCALPESLRLLGWLGLLLLLLLLLLL